MSLIKGHSSVLELLRNIQKRIFTVLSRLTVSHADNDYESEGDMLPDHCLPKDVKEGHLVVHSVGNGEVKRFVINMSYLTNPGFLRLLNQAEDEFGLEQEGVLAVACGAGELQCILESKTILPRLKLERL